MLALLGAPVAQGGVSDGPLPVPAQEQKDDEGVQDGWQDRPTMGPAPAPGSQGDADGSGAVVEPEGPPLPSDPTPTGRVPAPEGLTRPDAGDGDTDGVPVPPGRIDPRDLFELPRIGDEGTSVADDPCPCGDATVQDEGAAVATTGSEDGWLVPAATVTLAALATALLVRLAILLAIAAKVRLGYRIERTELLDHPVRKRISDHLAERPGATAGELAQVAGVTYARVCYHLAMMVREQALRVQRVDHRKRYFPYGAPRPDEEALRTQTLASPARMPGRILAFLRKAPGLSGSRLSRALGISPGHAHYHLSRLLDHGLLEARRKGREVRYYLTATGVEQAAEPWTTA